jgi:YidC/Oxa1 family membrane protein insertase
MHIFGDIFHVALYQPLFNALIWLYQYFPGHDFGVAIIVLTIITRIIIYPVMVSSIKSQKVMSEMQVKIKEIQKKYKDDKDKQTKEMIALYKKEGINPLGMYVPIIIQFIILIAFYKVVLGGLSPESMNMLYGFIGNPGTINPSFLGLIDLSKPNLVLAVLAGITQFFQGKMMMPKTKKSSGNEAADKFSNAMQKQMIYFFPLITVVFLGTLPSVIGIYWVTTSIFSIFQQYLIIKKENKQVQNA